MTNIRLPIPIRLLVIYLALLAFFATASWAGLDILEWVRTARNFVLILIAATATYQLFIRTGRARPTRNEHRIITALILFLLFDPLLSWWVFPILGVTAELLQRLIRTQIAPVLNPAAAAGLMLSFFGVFPGWWGVSFSPRIPIIVGGISSAVLLLPIAIYVAFSYKKLATVGGFFLAVATCIPLLLGKSPVFMLAEGTLLFFALVMIVEPKTSPILPMQQLAFGSLVGVLYTVLLKTHFFEPSLGALLITNLLWWIWKTYNSGYLFKK